jgi:hypothetical protein
MQFTLEDQVASLNPDNATAGFSASRIAKLEEVEPTTTTSHDYIFLTYKK